MLAASRLHAYYIQYYISKEGSPKKMGKVDQDTEIEERENSRKQRMR